MPMNFSSNYDVQLVENLGAAGTGALASTPIDVSGYAHVEFIIVLGTIGTGTASGLKVQGSPTSGGTYADITGATFENVAATDDDTIKRVGISVSHLPSDASGDPLKFLKVVGTVATEAIPLSILAVCGPVIDTTDTRVNAPEANV